MLHKLCLVFWATCGCMLVFENLLPEIACKHLNTWGLQSQFNTGGERLTSDLKYVCVWRGAEGG